MILYLFTLALVLLAWGVVKLKIKNSDLEIRNIHLKKLNDWYWDLYCEYRDKYFDRFEEIIDLRTKLLAKPKKKGGKCKKHQK